ncbi:hypothetical protein J6590_101957 [Homalodisca vitripennis]|nr:hypothetical protein J6590_007060 [Homalodisca vitripennis]KAG8314034.1 hypothetical protein J6590_101957 [Homalodisca vitripennis]
MELMDYQNAMTCRLRLAAGSPRVWFHVCTVDKSVHMFVTDPTPAQILSKLLQLPAKFIWSASSCLSCESFDNLRPITLSPALNSNSSQRGETNGYARKRKRQMKERKVRPLCDGILNIRSLYSTRTNGSSIWGREIAGGLGCVSQSHQYGGICVVCMNCSPFIGNEERPLILPRDGWWRGRRDRLAWICSTRSASDTGRYRWFDNSRAVAEDIREETTTNTFALTREYSSH